MSYKNRNVAIQPLISFMVIVILGIIIAQYVVAVSFWKFPIILLSFILGGILAIMELKRISKPSVNYPRKKKLSIEEKKRNLAKYVAEVFDEDITFDEIESTEENQSN